MVSKSGGTAPRWRGDGKELFFVTLEGAVASVPVRDQPVLEVGSLTTLFQAPGMASDWDVSADGKRFLIMVPEGRTTSRSFSLIFGWQRATRPPTMNAFLPPWHSVVPRGIAETGVPQGLA
jgi:hypothetical protein